MKGHGFAVADPKSLNEFLDEADSTAVDVPVADPEPVCSGDLA